MDNTILDILNSFGVELVSINFIHYHDQPQSMHQYSSAIPAMQFECTGGLLAEYDYEEIRKLLRVVAFAYNSEDPTIKNALEQLLTVVKIKENKNE